MCPASADALDGAHRPGHFDGVATVVARLFNQVQPDVAVFGAQGLPAAGGDPSPGRVTSQFPVDIVAGDTVRESDGLAMSSRNQYLNAEERTVASTIHRVLQAMR